MKYTIEQIRGAWLAAALEEWRHVVRDDDKGAEGNRSVITGYFDAVGWAPYLNAKTGGTYRETSATAWCGIFAAAMGMRIGDYLEDGLCVPLTLDPDLAKMVMPSTVRLAGSAKWRAAGVPRAVTYTGRVTDNAHKMRRDTDGTLVNASDVLLPGVIATVETSGRKPTQGDHIVIIELFDEDDGLIHTVEGNGRGRLGDGAQGEGVVRAVRALEDVVKVYQFDLEHFDLLERG